jgi:hypothetical protein
MKLKYIANKNGSFTNGKVYDVVWNSVKIKDDSVAEVKILDDDGDPWVMSYDNMLGKGFKEE